MLVFYAWPVDLNWQNGMIISAIKIKKLLRLNPSVLGLVLAVFSFIKSGRYTSFLSPAVYLPIVLSYEHI